MTLIGVVDLMAGRAVRARGGARQRYLPVARAGGTLVAGDPLKLAHAYSELGLKTLYVADLDAIAGAQMNRAMLCELAAVAPLWVDAGVASTEAAQRVADIGRARPVVGLETLPSFDALSAICASLGGAQVGFSLDLRDGIPVASAGLLYREPAPSIAKRATEAGAGTVLVVDLWRVGAAAGPDFDLLARVREAVPRPDLFMGGGIRGLDDMERLAGMGCDGAFVATAVYDGTLSAADVAVASRLERHGSVTR